MAEAVFTLRAEQDLSDIWASVAAENEPAADRLVERLVRKAKLCALHPLMGAPRPELSPTARILIEGRYLLIYEPTPRGDSHCRNRPRHARPIQLARLVIPPEIDTTAVPTRVPALFRTP